MSALKGGICYSCGTQLVAFDYGRGDTCRACRRDTRVCFNCIFHDRSFNNECREPQADRVVDKDRSNFCDYFSPNSGGPPEDQSAKLKSAAEELFKKKP